MARITQRVSSLEDEIVSLKEQLEESERKLRETDFNLREFKDAVQDALYYRYQIRFTDRSTYVEHT